MRRNVQMKALLRARAAAQGAAERRAGPGRALTETDTYFQVPRGRLKLRRTPDGWGELTFYERPAAAGRRIPSFSIPPTGNPSGLETLLVQALGVLGVVRKERLLFLIGQTRVYLDSVEGLGDFLELEVVLTEEQSVEDGERVACELMKELGVEEEDLISGAYLDLLLAIGRGANGS